MKVKELQELIKNGEVEKVKMTPSEEGYKRWMLVRKGTNFKCCESGDLFPTQKELGIIVEEYGTPRWYPSDEELKRYHEDVFLSGWEEFYTIPDSKGTVFNHNRII